MKILLAVDDSTLFDRRRGGGSGAPLAAGHLGSVLSAVAQIPPPAAELWYHVGGSLERAERFTQRTVEELSNAGVMAEAFVREGDPRSVIGDEAKDWDADLIILGSHGYTGFKRWLLGSVTQAVASHAPCSVEIVRRKQAAET